MFTFVIFYWPIFHVIYLSVVIYFIYLYIFFVCFVINSQKTRQTIICLYQNICNIGWTYRWDHSRNLPYGIPTDQAAIYRSVQPIRRQLYIRWFVFLSLKPHTNDRSHVNQEPYDIHKHKKWAFVDSDANGVPHNYPKGLACESIWEQHG